MDIGYNILKLEEILKKMIQNNLTAKKDIKYIIRDWLDEKEPFILNERELQELKKYSASSIRLTLEKMILMSLESKAYKVSYWKVLKEKEPKTRTFMLLHYVDALIDDIKKNVSSYDTNHNIDEIENFYHEQIKDSFQVLGDSINNVIANTKSISLNHMNNLNANGRTISVKDSNDNEKRIGGIFLNKESKIGYANFVNKEDLLKNLKKSTNRREIKLQNGTIRVYEFKRIINSLNQNLTIKNNTNVKNQDARLIMENDKKVGNIFLGKKGIDLENGTYISVEELSFALNQYVQEKNKADKKTKKVIKRKGKIRQAIASLALATSILSTLTLPKVEAKEDTKIISEHTLDEEDENLTTEEVVLNALELKNAIPGNVVEVSNLEKENIDSPMTEIFQQPLLENAIVEQSQSFQIENEPIMAKASEIIEEKMSSQPEEVVQVEQMEVKKEEQTSLEEIKEENNMEEQMEEPIVLSSETQEKEAEEKANEEVEEQTSLEEIKEENNMEEQMEEPIVLSSETQEKEAEEKANEEVEEQTSLEEETTNEIVEESSTQEPALNDAIPSSINQEENLGIINGQDVVNYAVQFVGNPYKYGGNSLTEGIDCSGFTKGVYSHFGIELPRTSQAQRSVGTSVGNSLENALPGDLVCYDGHVGIYAGDGQLVHASGVKTGIKIGRADYNDIITIQRIITPQIEKEESKVK